jgi:hypothetical protein
MKKIIFLFIVFLAFTQYTSSASNYVKRTVHFISNQVQSNASFNQNLFPSDFIGTDLLELAEDELSHFEKKLVAVSKTNYNSHSHSLDFSLAVLPDKIRIIDFFIAPYSSIHSFIGVFRI